MGTADKAWQDFPATSWEDADFPWNEYLNETGEQELLLGGQTGTVWVADNGNSDGGANISTLISSIPWNPFAQDGQRIQTGYIDIYYQVNTDAQLTFNFMVSDNSGPSLTRTVTLTGVVGQNTAWKRVYCNLVGEFVQLQIVDNQQSSWKILGMILWAKPSGRLIPGIS